MGIKTCRFYNKDLDKCVHQRFSIIRHDKVHLANCIFIWMEEENRTICELYEPKVEEKLTLRTGQALKLFTNEMEVALTVIQDRKKESWKYIPAHEFLRRIVNLVEILNADRVPEKSELVKISNYCMFMFATLDKETEEQHSEKIKV